MSKIKCRVRPPHRKWDFKRKAKVRYEEKRRKKYNGNRPPHMPYSLQTEEEIP